MVNHRSFHLGIAKVDPMRGVICIQGDEKRIEPQVMGVLMRLVAEPGEVVTREQLLESAWPDTIVNDGALSKAVSLLRRTLGDNAKRPQFIETIPKVGYRVVAQVRRIEVHLQQERSIHNELTAPTILKTPARNRAPMRSFLNVKLRELTVAQVLVLCAVVGLLFMFMPRTETLELEEEIILIDGKGTKQVVSDTSWTETRPYVPVKRLLSVAPRDTFIVHEVKGN